MFHSISLFVCLHLFWLLLSGFFSPFLFDRVLGANTVGTVAMLLLAATVHFRLDDAFASRILPYAVNELHVAEVGGVLAIQSD